MRLFTSYPFQPFFAVQCIRCMQMETFYIIVNNFPSCLRSSNRSIAFYLTIIIIISKFIKCHVCLQKHLTKQTSKHLTESPLLFTQYHFTSWNSGASAVLRNWSAATSASSFTNRLNPLSIIGSWICKMFFISRCPFFHKTYFLNTKNFFLQVNKLVTSTHVHTST